MFTYLDLQGEVKRRALRDQSGTDFDDAVKNSINISLFRVAREANWRVLRRKTHFMTKGAYDTGSDAVTVTNSATSASITGATLLSDNIEIGRRVKFGTDSRYYQIRTVGKRSDANAETIFTFDRKYEGTSSTGTTYEILPQAEYALPLQVNHRMFLWHEEYGYPYPMHFISEQEFWNTSSFLTDKNIPTHYRMWGENASSIEMKNENYIGVKSTDALDTATDVTIFGMVSSHPDYETIIRTATSGTVILTGTKLFTTVDRVVKDVSTKGRIIITTSESNYTIATIPAGDITSGVIYKKVQIWPLPQTEFPINVYYYKDPFRLVNDDDVHELGQEFDEAIILLSVAKLKYQESQKEGDRFYTMYQDEIRNLKKTNVDKIDWFPTLKKPSDTRKDALVVPNLSYRQVGGDYGPASR